MSEEAMKDLRDYGVCFYRISLERGFELIPAWEVLLFESPHHKPERTPAHE